MLGKIKVKKIAGFFLETAVPLRYFERLQADWVSVNIKTTFTLLCLLNISVCDMLRGFVYAATDSQLFRLRTPRPQLNSVQGFTKAAAE